MGWPTEHEYYEQLDADDRHQQAVEAWIDCLTPEERIKHLRDCKDEFEDEVSVEQFQEYLEVLACEWLMKFHAEGEDQRGYYP